MKHHVRCILIVLVVASDFPFVSRIAEGQDSSLPTPPNIKIERPASDLDQDLAVFSGTWEGAWGGQHLSRLIVERIDATSARVAYVWDDDPKGAFKRGFARYNAQVMPGNKIQFIRGEITSTFELAKGRKEIYGERRAGSGSTLYRVRATMKRVELPPATISPSPNTAPELPMPADLKIVSPSSELEPSLAAYSGIWEGWWDGGLFARLIVESLDASWAQVVYVFDSSPGNFKAGWSRVKSRVLKGGKLQWTFQNGNHFSFEMAEDRKSIRGESFNEKTQTPIIYTITMTPVI